MYGARVGIAEHGSPRFCGLAAPQADHLKPTAAGGLAAMTCISLVAFVAAGRAAAAHPTFIPTWNPSRRRNNSIWKSRV
jgi:hypothetical protein